MRKVKNLALGEDEECLRFLLDGGSTLMEEMMKLVASMHENELDKWKKSLRTRMVLQLYKMNVLCKVQ